MNTFLVHLQSATQYERIENVVSFIAEDDSGSFGILPGHCPHDDPACLRASPLPNHQSGLGVSGAAGAWLIS